MRNIIEIRGAAGSGKSFLLSKIAERLRRQPFVMNEIGGAEGLTDMVSEEPYESFLIDEVRPCLLKQVELVAQRYPHAHFIVATENITSMEAR